MGWTGWLIALGANAALVATGWLRSKRPRDAADWQLGARRLAWPAVGLSLFATAIDSGDFVAVVGGAYQYGIAYLSTWWIGLPLGWLLTTSAVLVPVYRAGFFTNAEFLEARFGPGMRLAGALVQLQQRTLVMGMMAYSLFLLLGTLTGWGQSAWWLVVALAALAAAYTAAGGLRAVVTTDSLQTVAIAAAAAFLWAAAWTGIGGWTSIRDRMAAIDPDLPRQLLSYDGLAGPGAPLALVLFGWITVHAAYCIVNHSQTMRLLGARSAFDMRAAAALATLVLIGVMWCNVSLGIVARALYPGLESVDSAFPKLLVDHAQGAAAGLVMAGVLAACLSTYDSIGSSLGAVFTRDVYCRFLRPGAGESEALTASRAAATVCIAESFCYIPFLGEGMVAFYLRLSSVAVVPLATAFTIGALTRVRKDAALPGLLAGMACGAVSMVGDRWAWPLPEWLTSVWWSYLWAVAVPAAVMAGWSAWKGPESRSAIAGLTVAGCLSGESYIGSGSGWLERSRAAAAKLAEAAGHGSGRIRPEILTAIQVAAAALAFFILFR